MKARKPNIFLTSANTPEENAIATPAVAATSAASVTGIDESNSLKSSSAASLVTAIRQSQHAELEDVRPPPFHTHTHTHTLTFTHAFTYTPSQPTAPTQSTGY